MRNPIWVSIGICAYETIFSYDQVLRCLLDAANMTRNWVVIDRSDALSSSPSAELMLEWALKATMSPPVVLNLESIHRFETFRPTPAINAQLIEIADIVLSVEVFVFLCCANKAS